jgi:uncharacterized protein YlaI
MSQPHDNTQLQNKPLKNHITTCAICYEPINTKTESYVKQRNIEKTEFTTYHPHKRREPNKSVQKSEVIEPIHPRCANRVRLILKAQYKRDTSSAE